jgi:hypothetical protein
MDTTRKEDQMEYFPSRAISNARATLSYFLRDDELPASSFRDVDTLIQLLEKGRRSDSPDPVPALADWLEQHPEPRFHPSD